MNCNKCGNEIKEGQCFCPVCGNPCADPGQDRYGDTIVLDFDLEDRKKTVVSESIEKEASEAESNQSEALEAVEVIDEESGEAVPENEGGEAVQTEGDLSSQGETEMDKSEAAGKKRNYDDVLKKKLGNDNVVLKAAILVVAVLIFTIGIGTIVFITSEINRDTTVRYNKLVELGAKQGVSKNAADEDLGKYLYVSGAGEYLVLRSEPSQDKGEEVAKLANGALVILNEKTDRLYWLVTDYATGVQGYASIAYLTSNPEKVIKLQNEEVESLGGLGENNKKIQELYFVLNAGVGIGIYSDRSLDDKTALDVLVDGNTVGLVNKVNDDIWWVYDYKSSQYGYMESKYLTNSLEALEMAKDEAAAAEDSDDQEEEESEDNEDKKGPEYFVSWSESALSVRDGPTQETGKQVNRIEYGDIVEVVEQTNDTFWYVYIPSLDMYGYVKGACLSPISQWEGDGEDSSEE